jgi:hypothetical protein
MDTTTKATSKLVREPAFRKPNQTRAARRRRELIDGLERDLGRAPNTAERELILQAADAILTREAMTAAAARGEPVSQDALLKVSNNVIRILASLRGKAGKQRGAPGPSLADYLARKTAEKVASASAGDPA